MDHFPRCTLERLLGRAEAQGDLSEVARLKAEITALPKNPGRVFRAKLGAVMAKPVARRGTLLARLLAEAKRPNQLPEATPKTKSRVGPCPNVPPSEHARNQWFTARAAKRKAARAAKRAADKAARGCGE